LCKWEDNIKMALKEMGYEFGLDSSFWRWGPVMAWCEYSNESLNSV
jgi:hypothetical protein